MQELIGLWPQQIKTAINDMSGGELLAVLHDWTLWARPDQLPPAGDWFVWMLRGGRGSGKTRTGAEFVIDRARSGARRIALVGQAKGDVRDTMIELGDSSILRCSPPWFRPQYEPSKRRLTWPNGCVAVAYSGDEPDQLRGPQHDTAWVDELAKFKYPQQTWDNLEMGMRLGDPRVVITTTPRPIPLIKKLLTDPRVVDVRCSTYDNIYLAEQFLTRVKSMYEGTRLGRQEIYGEVLDDNPRALWKRNDIESSRVVKQPDLQRIVVGVDPEAESGAESAETGIVVVGIATVNGLVHGYVLDDVSLRATPDVWARAVISAYNRHKADAIVVEVNNGGEMVTHTIRTVSSVNCKSVRATRGKYTRAEPVAALYEQGRIHHVGFFPELEDQMCEWSPEQKSPDRMDALVWAVTELMGEQIEQVMVTYDAMQEVDLMI